MTHEPAMNVDERDIPDDATSPKDRLRAYMSELSEYYECAGWLSGLSDVLWVALHGGPTHFWGGEPTEGELALLRRLHEEAGGWWDGEEFVTTAEWRERLGHCRRFPGRPQ